MLMQLCTCCICGCTVHEKQHVDPLCIRQSSDIQEHQIQPNSLRSSSSNKGQPPKEGSCRKKKKGRQAVTSRLSIPWMRSLTKKSRLTHIQSLTTTISTLRTWTTRRRNTSSIFEMLNGCDIRFNTIPKENIKNVFHISTPEFAARCTHTVNKIVGDSTVEK